jgi:hypothetical protein
MIPVIIRQFRAVVMVIAAFALSACYRSSAQPETASLVERRAEFLISDEGRGALRSQLGAGAGKFEGKVVRQDEQGWTVRVYRLSTISGESFAWAGEAVELPRRAVYGVATRDFDPQATVLLAVGVSGAVAAFILTRGLFGFGAPGNDPGCTGDCTGTELRR